VTATYVLLWLISSSAWADAVSKIKMYTNPHEYFDEHEACECAEETVANCIRATKCEVTDEGNYATINVSAVSTVLLRRLIASVSSLTLIFISQGCCLISYICL